MMLNVDNNELHDDDYGDYDDDDDDDVVLSIQCYDE